MTVSTLEISDNRFIYDKNYIIRRKTRLLNVNVCTYAANPLTIEEELRIL